MGKADTHRDAHLRLFIPRGAYNTSITGDIPERLPRGKETLASVEGKESTMRRAEAGVPRLRRNVHGLKSLELSSYHL